MINIIKKSLNMITWFFILANATQVHSKQLDNCDKSTLAKQPHKVLSCYIAKPELIKNALQFINKEYDEKYKVSIETYNFKSQYWPKHDKAYPSRLWQHRLTIYKPTQLIHSQALLFVNGGTRYPTEAYNPGPQNINFARIASLTNSIVVDLQDIPNQYLTFSDEIPRREDGIVAYTWNRYMQNTFEHVDWPLHLPMTKSVVRAMDAVQKIAKEKYQHVIKNFMVTGASKRGWTTWLTALADERVNAIAPIVIDILNINQNLNLIYKSYNNQWPPAFYDYIEQKITERFNTPEFQQLVKIQDPIAYLNCKQCADFVSRLSIPKYIINASGDDFFVPDSLATYVNLLPGETKLRTVPNQNHNIDASIIENSLLVFFQSIVKQIARPQINWNVDEQCKVTLSTTRNANVKIWEAINEKTRDFRLAANIHYVATPLSGQCQNRICHFDVQPRRPEAGFKASFVEVTFPKTKFTENFVLTTPPCIQAAG